MLEEVAAGVMFSGTNQVHSVTEPDVFALPLTAGHCLVGWPSISLSLHSVRVCRCWLLDAAKMIRPFFCEKRPVSAQSGASFAAVIIA